MGYESFLPGFWLPAEVHDRNDQDCLMGDVGAETTHVNAASAGRGALPAARLTADVVTPRKRATVAPG